MVKYKLNIIFQKHCCEGVTKEDSIEFPLHFQHSKSLIIVHTVYWETPKTHTFSHKPSKLSVTGNLNWRLIPKSNCHWFDSQMTSPYLHLLGHKSLHRSMIEHTGTCVLFHLPFRIREAYIYRREHEWWMISVCVLFVIVCSGWGDKWVQHAVIYFVFSCASKINKRK